MLRRFYIRYSIGFLTRFTVFNFFMNIDLLNTQRIAPLLPELMDRAQEFISDCEYAGVKILVTQGLRTWAEQNDLYAQGRTKFDQHHTIVTNARGGESYHNFGLAFDIVPIDTKGQPIWDTKNDAWKTVEEIGAGHLHVGSIDTRLAPEFIQKIVAQDLGFTWGGDFKSICDIPHFELTGGCSLQLLRNLYEPGNLKKCWNEVMQRMK